METIRVNGGRGLLLQGRWYQVILNGSLFKFSFRLGRDLEVQIWRQR